MLWFYHSRVFPPTWEQNGGSSNRNFSFPLWTENHFKSSPFNLPKGTIPDVCVNRNARTNRTHIWSSVMLSASLVTTARIWSNLKIQMETMDKIETIIFFAKMGGPVVCYQNKYTIKLDNLKDSIQARCVPSFDPCKKFKICVCIIKLKDSSTKASSLKSWYVLYPKTSRGLSDFHLSPFQQ